VLAWAADGPMRGPLWQGCAGAALAIGPKAHQDRDVQSHFRLSGEQQTHNNKYTLAQLVPIQPTTHPATALPATPAHAHHVCMCT
jgi:hypothetical protein